MTQRHPRHDTPGPHKDLGGAPEHPPSRASAKRMEAAFRERLRRRGEGPDPAPVEPPPDRPMSGGAAATAE